MDGSDQPRNVTLQLPRKLKFLLDCHPYKVAYGGRNSLKSHSFAGALLTLGIKQDLRILCAREVQKSLAQSVHQLLQDKIEALDYGDLYVVTDEAIRCRITNTLFRFTGLADHTAESIKSYEGFDVAWLEEAQAIVKRSRQILFPTIFRTPGAEIWESFNPNMDTDDAWERYIINPPPGAVVQEMNYRDAIACGFWTDEQEQLRQYDLVYAKADYDNIWEGKPRAVVAGAIYTSEITDMAREGRYRPTPYDPRLPVHRIWDLGWNDLMVIIMVQKPTPTTINVVNYFEDKFIKYSDVIETLSTQCRYKWGDDWLPHDSANHHPTSGTNAKKQIKALTGRQPKDIPKSDPEARIRASRMMFPRVYADNTKRPTPPERPDMMLGAAHLMDRLKRYRRHIPKNTGEEASPIHDITSHGADAWGGLAEIVDRIRNEIEEPIEVLPQYSNTESSMGVLG